FQSAVAFIGRKNFCTPKRFVRPKSNRLSNRRPKAVAVEFHPLRDRRQRLDLQGRQRSCTAFGRSRTKRVDRPSQCCRNICSLLDLQPHLYTRCSDACKLRPRPCGRPWSRSTGCENRPARKRSSGYSYCPHRG